MCVSPTNTCIHVNMRMPINTHMYKHMHRLVKITTKLKSYFQKFEPSKISCHTVFTYTYVHTQLYTHTRMHTRVLTNKHVLTHTYAHFNINAHTYTHTHVHTHTCTHAQMHTHNHDYKETDSILCIHIIRI